MDKENDMDNNGKPNIPERFLKPYDPATTEDRVYEMWEKSGYFNPDKLPERNGKGGPFSMVLPPPNVTGQLHLGSALMLAIEDIMARYARMKGKKTLWIPGTDHAAIATQAVVEKEIQKKEGKSRHDLGRDELLRRIDAHVKTTHDVIVSQIRKLGCSIDWSREAFTLDDKRNLAVRTAFKRMYDDGLIYRGFRVVNWDPKGQTTISDDEIEYETRKAKLYTFKYGKDAKTGELIPIAISTTRPETKLGDTAIAVNPDDARYKPFISREFDAVFAGEPIHLKIVADPSVEPGFGTGALGVTPAHSMIDWEMAQRHGLPLKQVIGEYARMTAGFDEHSAPAPAFVVKGKKVAEAREAVVAWLKAEGLLEKEEEIEHNIALAQRTGGVIEPLPKLQWFVAVNKEFDHNGQKTTLKKLMKEAVSSGAVKIIPERFEKVYFNWIDNLRDWCISRQIWYGHRIPVWYREGEAPENIFIGIDAPEGDGWMQDDDTLDTWFSSGLWTFSTLGWPDEKEFKANKEYHPTTMLETGWDILFFWVARMILMSEYLLGEAPFKTVYLHGLVRDTKNRKISKSLGNNIDPLDMIVKYGADAVRMSLVVGVGPGNDSKIDEAKIKAYKLFANKLWNIGRFVFENTGDGEDLRSAIFDLRPKSSMDSEFTKKDKEYADRLDELMAEITGEMDEYKFYIVAEKLYHYAWHELADVILEESKGIFRDGSEIEKKSRRRLLLYIFDKLLRALHPFMPYITEEIYRALTSGQKMLMVEEWVA
ncbi:valine--tRNA ligase [Patescibacteria group bacterium]|nr:valine--tRNA ligase [Patescibacteria group bacterium]MDE1946958.1 valine--tRNA ligase [Patescibacteria group bacterium]MDE2011231.1 valine--tRNA ligase [Patescibacteria group bacterium]MDE2233395.1 valine--tRNA ligase [Patescibacteria group bacterium]